MFGHQDESTEASEPVTNQETTLIEPTTDGSDNSTLPPPDAAVSDDSSVIDNAAGQVASEPVAVDQSADVTTQPSAPDLDLPAPAPQVESTEEAVPEAASPDSAPAETANVDSSSEPPVEDSPLPTSPALTNAITDDNTSSDSSTTTDAQDTANSDDTATESTESTDSTSVDSSTTTDNPTNAESEELLNIKQSALQQLTPLVDQLDQTPEEKFHTMMMMIQASDDQSLIHAAFDAAKEISDDKTRAQALLDIVNEINYFTQHQPIE